MNTVTIDPPTPSNRPAYNSNQRVAAQYVVRRCRCDCWFCPECCFAKGMKLREQLVRILTTFHGIAMVTLTVDPDLFPCPRFAHDYLADRRCVSRTVRDLHRRGHTFTKRFFSVMEWQRQTEYVHFHVLLDAVHVPHFELMQAWSAHRPPDASPAMEDRPHFGWAYVSAPVFEGGAEQAAHAAATYLTKFPQSGFPSWVMAMGRDRRLRRYSTSRGFWNRPCRPRSSPRWRRASVPQTYAERTSRCGTTGNLFALRHESDAGFDERRPTHQWLAQLAPAQTASADRCSYQFPRQPIASTSIASVVQAAEQCIGRPVQVLRSRGCRTRRAS